MKIALSVKLGIIFGIANCLIWYLIARSLGFYPLEVYRYKFFISLLLLVCGILVSVYSEKRKAQGFIEFKMAVKTGLLYTIIFSFITAAFTYTYHTYIITDAINSLVSEEKKAWLAHNRTEEETNRYIIEYYIPSFGSYHTLMTNIMWGVILSLLTGAIFRKKNPSLPFSAN